MVRSPDRGVPGATLYARHQRLGLCIEMMRCGLLLYRLDRRVALRPLPHVARAVVGPTTAARTQRYSAHRVGAQVERSGSTAPDLGHCSVAAGDAALLGGVEPHPLLALLATLAVVAGRLPASVLGLGALDAAPAAVVHVVAQGLLAPVLPVAVAVAPARLARVLALAAAALGAGIRAALALGAARAAVVQVVAHGLLAPILPVAVAVGPSRLAAVLAAAAAALGDGIGAALALGAAGAAVEHVLADVLLTPILPVVVAVSPAGLAGVLTLAFAALGNGVRAALTLLAAVAAVRHIVVDVGLAPVLVVVVAVLGAFFAPRVGRACMDKAENTLSLQRAMNESK
jgi:hypothetical protein